MKRSIFALAAVVAMSMASGSAQAQCPANPLTALSTNFTFKVEGLFPNIYGIAGVMKPSLGTDRAGNPIGILTITASSSDSFGSVTRLETDAGRYQINANCTGGTLTFNLSSRPMQYDFWFYDGGRQMYIVSTINGLPATGHAVVAPTGCPAGLGSPLQLLTGNWTFHGRGVGPLNPYGIAGVFTASQGPDRAGNIIGLLAVTATSNIQGSITRLEGDAGRYQANADCSGGTLTFNLSSLPTQHDFWYVDGFQQLYFISTGGRYPLLGTASR